MQRVLFLSVFKLLLTLKTAVRQNGLSLLDQFRLFNGFQKKSLITFPFLFLLQKMLAFQVRLDFILLLKKFRLRRIFQKLIFFLRKICF